MIIGSPQYINTNSFAACNLKTNFSSMSSPTRQKAEPQLVRLLGVSLYQLGVSNNPGFSLRASWFSKRKPQNKGSTNSNSNRHKPSTQSLPREIVRSCARHRHRLRGTVFGGSGAQQTEAPQLLGRVEAPAPALGAASSIEAPAPKFGVSTKQP